MTTFIKLLGAVLLVGGLLAAVKNPSPGLIAATCGAVLNVGGELIETLYKILDRLDNSTGK